MWPIWHPQGVYSSPLTSLTHPVTQPSCTHRAQKECPHLRGRPVKGIVLLCSYVPFWPPLLPAPPSPRPQRNTFMPPSSVSKKGGQVPRWWSTLWDAVKDKQSPIVSTVWLHTIEVSVSHREYKKGLKCNKKTETVWWTKLCVCVSFSQDSIMTCIWVSPKHLNVKD